MRSPSRRTWLGMGWFASGPVEVVPYGKHAPRRPPVVPGRFACFAHAPDARRSHTTGSSLANSWASDCMTAACERVWR